MRPTQRLGRALDWADRHHGLLRTSVLAAEGLTPRQIAALVEDGILERIIRGLYRLAGSRSPLQDIAAVVTRHATAAASHTSALYVHGLDVHPPQEPHHTLPPGCTSGTTLGVLHRSPLPRTDVTRRRGIPVTTLARSLVDAAEVLSVDELAAALNEAVSRRLVRLPDVLETAARLERAPGRKGSGRLRAVLSTWTEAIAPDSVAEAAAVRRIRLAGLPAPVTQHVVVDGAGGFVARLDLAWPDELVAREYDSVAFHGPDRIEADELRRQRLEQLGWSIEPLYRHHLLPGEVGWLGVLQRDLRRGRRAAS